MYEIRVESSFSAAHFLTKYNGKCERLHGHNYRVFAHVRGTVLDEGGMLIDFAKLKGALRSVVDSLDHYNLNDFDYFEQNPSAERIATYIYDHIIELLPSLAKKGDGSAYLSAVDVFETDTSRARYCVDD